MVEREFRTLGGRLDPPNRASLRGADKAPPRELTTRHQALTFLEEYIINLEVELEKIKKYSEEELHRTQQEIRSLRERCEEREQEIERLLRIRNQLEHQVENLEGQVDEERKKNAILDKQVRTFTKELAEARTQILSVEEKLDVSLTKNQETQNEIEKLVASKSRLESRLEDRESSLNEERRKVFDLDKQSRRLSNLIGELRNKNELLEVKITDIEAKHVEQVKKLNNRLQYETESEVRQFQNRIESGLISDFKDYEKYESIPVTPEIGENLKHLLKMIFARLAELGIDFRKTGR